MASAYESFLGGNPSFTNFSLIMLPWDKEPDKKPFVDCLDYIFIDEDRFNVSGVVNLPATTDELGGVLPTVEEPSDHLLIGAVLTLV
jgi:hypothetical protein